MELVPRACVPPVLPFGVKIRSDRREEGFGRKWESVKRGPLRGSLGCRVSNLIAVDPHVARDPAKPHSLPLSI